MGLSHVMAAMSWARLIRTCLQIGYTPKKLMLDHQVPYVLMAMIGGISWYLSFSDRARFNLNNIMVIP